MKKFNVSRVNPIVLIAFISISLFVFSACSILDSFDTKAQVRFKNDTAETFAGVRVDGGAEYDKPFAPSATTGYMDNDAGNFNVDVKIGETWTRISVLDGGNLSITTGSDYTITIAGASPDYTAAQAKD